MVKGLEGGKKNDESAQDLEEGGKLARDKQPVTYLTQEVSKQAMGMLPSYSCGRYSVVTW